MIEWLLSESLQILEQKGIRAQKSKLSLSDALFLFLKLCVQTIAIPSMISSQRGPS
jgi:hypothetical protein